MNQMKGQAKADSLPCIGDTSVTHQCRQRIQASTASSVLACHFESVDLEHANYVIDFLLGKSISELASAKQVSNNVLFDIPPMRLMAFFIHMIHHGLSSILTHIRAESIHEVVIYVHL